MSDSLLKQARELRDFVRSDDDYAFAFRAHDVDKFLDAVIPILEREAQFECKHEWQEVFMGMSSAGYWCHLCGSRKGKEYTVKVPAAFQQRTHTLAIMAAMLYPHDFIESMEGAVDLSKELLAEVQKRK